MGERAFRGTPASPGVAVGRARVVAPRPAEAHEVVAPGDRPAEAARAQAALDGAARELEALAERLAADGRTEEAEIVATGALMAGDPGLRSDVTRLATSDGRPAAAAILEATDAAAAVLAAIPDAVLAERADDVRSLGRRAARIADGRGAGTPGDGGDAILVADDLGPADVAELGPDVHAIALARSGPAAHAAIVARSLGIPLAVALGDDLLDVTDGATLVIDGDAGIVTAEPSAARQAQAAAARAQRDGRRRRELEQRALPAETLDGRRVRVLANVVSPAEVRDGLDRGAEGAGLIRTELWFLDAAAWPDEAAHRRALAPVLHALAGRTATVRVLDFGGDKTPPFLRGSSLRGLDLLLAAPDAFDAQLRATLDAGRDCELRVMLPMVHDGAGLAAASAALDRAAAAVGVARPLLGAMVETPEAAAAADELAAAADFLSIGTNDLTHATVGTDRFAGGEAHPHDPRVLRHIASCAAATRAAGRILEVCGEAASSPLTVPLLLGLGVDELSVGAARVGTTRAWVRALRAHDARALAEEALLAPDAGAVAELAAPVVRALELLERGDAAAQDADGVSGVAALRP